MSGEFVEFIEFMKLPIPTTLRRELWGPSVFSPQKENVSIVIPAKAEIQYCK